MYEQAQISQMTSKKGLGRNYLGINTYLATKAEKRGSEK